MLFKNKEITWFTSKVRVIITVLIITACINGTYGKDCMYNCTDMCPNGDFCNKIDGSCSECSSECNKQMNSRFLACDLTHTPLLLFKIRAFHTF